MKTKILIWDDYKGWVKIDNFKRLAKCGRNTILRHREYAPYRIIKWCGHIGAFEFRADTGLWQEADYLYEELL